MRRCPISRASPAASGTRSSSATATTAALANTDVFNVPPDHFFMMGDNRDNSRIRASRRPVGYVPEENLVGRAEIIFFSVDDGAAAWQFWRWPTSVRWSRCFMRVH